MGQAFLYGNGSGGSGGTLVVTAPAGVTCTITKDGKTKSKTVDQYGYATFKGLDTGVWTVTISGSGMTQTDTVEITTDYAKEMSFYKIYGICRDITNSSPEWTREKDAVGMSATATVGTVAGSSDFDSCYPWSDITRETLSTGDVMVKIPKFWYRRYREGNVEHIQIAEGKAEGFTLHPAFNHGGVEQDCIYVGAYKISSSNKSVTGASPQVSLTRAKFRTNARNKGDGWGIYDISTVSAVQMLILVEFANNNTQTVIGTGYAKSNNTATKKTGTCDSVTNLTGSPAGTSGTVDVVWRGIEGLWGNAWEWIDGVNWNDGSYYVCNDPESYADDTATNYEKLSYTGATGWSASYITEAGLDTGNNSHVMFPSAAGNGSDSTYMCDAAYGGTGWRVVRRGGSYTSDTGTAGLFTLSMLSGSSDTNTSMCSRLLYIPQ